MTVLFIPRPQNFAGAPAGGSGSVVQWTYTVPAGKRAELTHVYCRIDGNGNAANTTLADIFCLFGAVAVTAVFLNGSGIAAHSSKEVRVFIDLQAGDVVQGRSTNTGAAAVAMQIRAVIREYQ